MSGSGISDWQQLGVFPLQDHERDVPPEIRQTLVGCRIAKVADENSPDSLTEYGIERDMGTMGDIHPWFFWQTEDRGLRGMGSWAMCFAAMTTGGGSGGFSRGGTGTTLQPSDVHPIWDWGYATDTRYQKKAPHWPASFPTLPQGTMVLVLPTTDEGKQQEIMLHADPRLIAVNASGPGSAGTLVGDLQGNGEICVDGSTVPGVGGRLARLQSMMRVVAMPRGGVSLLRTGPGNSIAWNLTGTQQEGLAGYGLCYARLSGRSGPITSHPKIPRLPTPITPQPRNPIGINNPLNKFSASNLNDDPEIEEGPNPPEDSRTPESFGEFRPRARKGFGLMAVSSEASGPLHPGSVSDKHFIGSDADGHAINAGHISTNAYFFGSASRDGPLEFGGLYPDPEPQPLISRVHLTWDPKVSHGFIGGGRDGMWRWYAEYHVVVPKTGDPPGGGRRGGGGKTGSPGVPSTPTTPTPPSTPTPGTPTPGTPSTPTPGVPSTPTPPTTGGPGTPTTPTPRAPSTPSRPGGGSLPTPITPQPRNPHPQSPSRMTPTTPGPRDPGPLPEPMEPDDRETPITPYPSAPKTPGPPGPPTTPPARQFTDGRQTAIDRMKAAAPDPTGSKVSVGDVGPDDVGLYILHHPFAESFTELAFRPQLMAQGYPSFTHNGRADGDFIQADEGVRPQVIMARAWGAMNADSEWDYVENPALSRARGGTSNGGVLYTPPAFELEDYFGIGSSEDVESPTTQSYITAAPGVAFALGLPNLDGGLNAKAITFDQDETHTNHKGYIRQLDSTRVGQALIDLELDQSGGEVVVGIGGEQAFRLPRGTQAQRQANIGLVGGEIRTVTDGGADQLEFYDAQGATWTTLASGGGATTFLGLTDTPGSYAGAALQAVRVDSTGLFLEFIDLDTIYATDADLTTHKTSADHDGRYHTQTDLGSTTIGFGADLIGIADIGGIITAITVEDALQENRAALDVEEAALVTHKISADHDARYTTTSILSSTAGAGGIGILDAGALFAAIEIESALAETATALNVEEAALVTHKSGTDHDSRYHTQTDLGSVALNLGATLIGVHDAGAIFTGVNVEDVLVEIQVALNAEEAALVAHKTSADHDGRYTTTTILGSVLNGQGASTIGIEDAGSIFTGTDVEAALNELAANIVILIGLLGNYTTTAVLASTAGAGGIGILDAGAIITATTVEGALAEIQTALDVEEAALVTHKSSSDHDSRYVELAGDTMTGALLAAVGTVLLPGLAFAGDPDTGLYRIGANQLGFGTAGVNAIEVDASQNTGFSTAGASMTHKVNIIESTAGLCLRLEGDGSFGSGGRLSFGDGTFVWIEEETDDFLSVYSSNGTTLKVPSLDKYNGVGDVTTHASTWHTHGSRSVAVSGSQTGAFTAGDLEVYLCDTNTLGAFTVTLPAASGATGRVYTFKKTDSSANVLTVTGNASETIDGVANWTTATQYDALTVVCDGTGWHMMSFI